MKWNVNLNANWKHLFPTYKPSRIAVLLTVLALGIVIPLSAVAVRAAESSRRTAPARPSHGPDAASLAVAAAPMSDAAPAPVVIHKPSKINMMAGNASWYGAVLQGHRTASGAIFDENQLTAAHRTLPFGTMVRVIDLRNHRTVIVKITDRGVLFPDRAIDLSHAAAAELNMLRDGVHPVRLEIMPKNDSSLAAYRAQTSNQTANLIASSTSKVD